MCIDDAARNALKIENETTPVIVRWRRVASMAFPAEKAPGRRDRTGLVGPVQLVVVHLEEDRF